MPQSRQLAAIMFTDIVGYTALMGDDEQRAFEILNKSRSLQKPLVDQYGGRWIKELGDGVLSTFSTVTDAVNCACSVMEDLKMKLKEGKYVSSCIMSYAYGFLGDIDEAINWLERAYEEHDAYLCIIKFYPFVPVKLRQDSRFNSFLSKVNFPG
jgi:hypothetical protein